jgi:hypothetical protein
MCLDVIGEEDSHLHFSAPRPPLSRASVLLLLLLCSLRPLPSRAVHHSLLSTSASCCHHRRHARCCLSAYTTATTTLARSCRLALLPLLLPTHAARCPSRTHAFPSTCCCAANLRLSRCSLRPLPRDPSRATSIKSRAPTHGSTTSSTKHLPPQCTSHHRSLPSLPLRDLRCALRTPHTIVAGLLSTSPVLDRLPLSSLARVSAIDFFGPHCT